MDMFAGSMATAGTDRRPGAARDMTFLSGEIRKAGLRWDLVVFVGSSAESPASDVGLVAMRTSTAVSANRDNRNMKTSHATATAALGSSECCRNEKDGYTTRASTR